METAVCTDNVEKVNLDDNRKLLEYRINKQHYESILLDLLRANELGEEEYHKITNNLEAAYVQFKKDL